MGRALLWIAIAALLVALGWTGLLAAAYGALVAQGSVTPENTRTVRAGLYAAWILVGVKGLLPQTLLAGGIASAILQWAPGWRAPRWRVAAACALASAAAYTIVGPLLLTADHPRLPGLHPRDAIEHLGTFLSTSAGVATALLMARLGVFRGDRRSAPQGEVGHGGREIG